MKIEQNRVIPQGDALSCSGFMLFLAKLPGKIAREFNRESVWNETTVAAPDDEEVREQ